MEKKQKEAPLLSAGALASDVHDPPRSTGSADSNTEVFMVDEYNQESHAEVEEDIDDEHTPLVDAEELKDANAEPKPGVEVVEGAGAEDVEEVQEMMRQMTVHDVIQNAILPRDDKQANAADTLEHDPYRLDAHPQQQRVDDDGFVKTGTVGFSDKYLSVWGVGCFCSIRKTPTNQPSFHVTAVLTFAFAFLLSLFFFLISPSAELVVFENPFYKWLLAAALLLVIMYVTALIQSLLELIADRLLVHIEEWRYYFAVNASMTSFGLVSTLTIAATYWDEVLSFHHESAHNNIDRWFTCFILFALFDIPRKFFVQYAILSYNERTYRKRAEQMKFRENVVFDLGGEGNIQTVLETETGTTLLGFAKLLNNFKFRKVQDLLDDFVGADEAGMKQKPVGLPTHRKPSRKKDGRRDRVIMPETLLGERINKLTSSVLKVLDKDKKGYLTLADFESRYPAKVALRVYRMFDTNPDSAIQREEISRSLREFFEDRDNLYKSLNGFQSLANIVSRVHNFVYGFLMVIITLVVFDYNVQWMIFTFTSLLVSVSFAFGGTIMRMVDSTVFLLLGEPYFTGDKIKIGTGESLIYIVEKVEFYNTTFKDSYNCNVKIPNYVLATKEIINLKRSNNAVFDIEVELNLSTPPEKIHAFVDDVRQYILRQRLVWLPSVSTHTNSLSPYKNTMTLSMWFTHRADHADKYIFSDRTKLIVFMRQALLRIGLGWSPLPQPITVSGTIKSKPE